MFQPWTPGSQFVLSCRSGYHKRLQDTSRDFHSSPPPSKARLLASPRLRRCKWNRTGNRSASQRLMNRLGGRDDRCHICWWRHIQCWFDKQGRCRIWCPKFIRRWLRGLSIVLRDRYLHVGWSGERAGLTREKMAIVPEFGKTQVYPDSAIPTLGCRPTSC